MGKDLTPTLTTSILGNPFYHYDECDSTQNILKDKLVQGESIGTTVMTDRQTKGRGQHGKSWTDMGGTQLFASIALPCHLQESIIPIMNLGVSLCAAQTLTQNYKIKNVHVKWPNDLYIDQKKVGGVISELYRHQSGPSLITGLGINIEDHQENLPKECQNKTASLQTLHKNIKPIGLLENILLKIEKNIIEKNQNNITSWIQSTYAKFDLLQGKTITIQSPDLKITTGKACGIDLYGRLLLEDENNVTVSFVGGHIQYIGN